jgi:RHS repeat-associated protein
MTTDSGYLDRRSTRGRLTLLALTLGSGVAILDGSVVNVAVRTIGVELDASLGQLQWVLSGYLRALASLVLVGGALGAVMFLLVLQLQVSAGWSALAAGVSTLPVTVALMPLSSRAAALSHRIGPRVPMSLGPLLCAAGVVALLGIGPGAGWYAVLSGMTVFALGLALLVSPLTATVLAAVPQRQAGVASGVNNAVARAGSLLAVAALPALAYTRDVLGRVVTRTATGGETSTTRYGFTGTDDSPDLQLTTAGGIGERYIALPGGVLLTKGYAASTSSWAVSNLHGDVTATITGTTVTAGFVYDPYGQPLNGASGVVDAGATPATRTGTTTDAWHGSAQRGYEHTGGLNQMLMGARTYLPALGIFTATDPVEGGNTTTYAYPQDPVNGADLTGTTLVPDPGLDEGHGRPRHFTELEDSRLRRREEARRANCSSSEAFDGTGRQATTDSGVFWES